MMIGNAAPLLAPLAGSAVISYTAWVGVFVYLGLSGLFLTFITTWERKESLPVERRVPSNFRGLARIFKTLLMNRMFMGYALAPGIMFAGEYSALPLGIIVFTTSLLSIVAYIGLVSNKEERSMR